MQEKQKVESGEQIPSVSRKKLLIVSAAVGATLTAVVLYEFSNWRVSQHECGTSVTPNIRQLWFFLVKYPGFVLWANLWILLPMYFAHGFFGFLLGCKIGKKFLKTWRLQFVSGLVTVFLLMGATAKIWQVIYEDYILNPPSDDFSVCWKRVTGEETLSNAKDDNFKRVLGVTVSGLKNLYDLGESIPITVCIKNHRQESHETVKESSHPVAQLFPFLTVWIEEKTTGKQVSEKIILRFKNRIRIKQGEKFTYCIDLTDWVRQTGANHAIQSDNPLLQTGTYSVSIGHQNWLIEDIGDWTGTLRSRIQTFRIIADW